MKNIKILTNTRIFSKREYDISINETVIIIKALNKESEYIYDKRTYSVLINETDIITYKKTIKCLGEVVACNNANYKIRSIISQYHKSEWSDELTLISIKPTNMENYKGLLLAEFFYQGSLIVESLSHE